MKRLLVLCAVIVPLSFFVAGCGGTGGSSGKSSGAPPAEQQKAMQEKMQQMMKSGKMGSGMSTDAGKK